MIMKFFKHNDQAQMTQEICRWTSLAHWTLIKNAIEKNNCACCGQLERLAKERAW